jgi:hypothetical protein
MQDGIAVRHEGQGWVWFGSQQGPGRESEAFFAHAGQVSGRPQGQAVAGIAQVDAWGAQDRGISIGLGGLGHSRPGLGNRQGDRQEHRVTNNIRRFIESPGFLKTLSPNYNLKREKKNWCA